MRFSTRAPVGEQPWVRWFAWYPVRTGLTGEYTWLEHVERKKCYEFEHTKSFSYYVYRSITKENQ